jgi:hypothetical protein
MSSGEQGGEKGQAAVDEIVGVATCRCGHLRAECKGEPIRVSVCHCLECQKRTGSAFAAQARWPDGQVSVSGKSSNWVRTADSGSRSTFRFCPDCGSTVAYVSDGRPGVTAIPLGAFADPSFPAPRFSVYEHRKHPWTVVLGDEVEHSVTPTTQRPHKIQRASIEPR